MIWLSADIHFWDSKIIRKAHRPFRSIEDMNDEIIDRFNGKVSGGDTLILLGDVGREFQAHLDFCSRLHCRDIQLIPGNHDPESHLSQLYNRILPHIYSFQYEGVHVVLSHYPIMRWNRSSKGSVHFYGHIHDDELHNGRSMNIGVDRFNFYPIDLPTAISKVIDLPVAI